MLSAVLGFTGVSIVTIAFSQLDEAFFEATRGAFQVAVTGPLLMLIWVVVVLVMTAAGTALYQSRRINSLALKLTAQHVMTDAWLTGLVLAGLMAIGQGYQWIDPVLSIFLAVMAVRSLWQVLHEQLPMLLKPTAIAPEAIAQIACQIEGVTRCTRILSRGMVGRQVWIELHLALHPEFMVIAHTIGARVERSLREHYGPVRAQIIMEQPQPSDPIGPKYRVK